MHSLNGEALTCRWAVEAHALSGILNCKVDFSITSHTKVEEVYFVIIEIKVCHNLMFLIFVRADIYCIGSHETCFVFPSENSTYILL